MCTVYQVNPSKPILHHFYHLNNITDALRCARQVMAHHYKAIVVEISDKLRTYVGEPSGTISVAHSDESVLQELKKLTIR